MSVFTITFLFMYMSSVLVFVFKRKHLLVMLLSLESSVVALYVGFFLYFKDDKFWIFLLMVYLAMSVCEGALGLSLLVLMIRVHSNDFIMSFNSLW
uniref:NADH-ubiquinone oxidoreductase chain 4L n=1 Tax=Otiorhynchus rugosostriatus TaxID=703598 RepID=J9PHC2_9CUCU|nr:NADH dehydrogenase subunit 4L [Otiorhynchus rugosostriatus]